MKVPVGVDYCVVHHGLCESDEYECDFSARRLPEEYDQDCELYPLFFEGPDEPSDEEFDGAKVNVATFSASSYAVDTTMGETPTNRYQWV